MRSRLKGMETVNPLLGDGAGGGQHVLFRSEGMETLLGNLPSDWQRSLPALSRLEGTKCETDISIPIQRLDRGTLD